jgi:geranylgeranyl pyrophosphate synthase
MKTAREQNNDRLWIMPFLGQLTDDCRDFNDDMKSKSVTPFTYYASLKQQKSNVSHLLNPFYTFLNLCSDIYTSSNYNHQTGAFLGRRIARSLRSIEITGNKTSFLQFLNLFSSDNICLYDYFSNKLYKQFNHITDPEKHFFRIIDVLSTKYSKTNRKLETYIGENLMKIEDALIIRPLHSQEQDPIYEENILISAMNYSVKAGGKRLRPLLILMVADLCNIELNRILPLVCAIEYLHTSSLIFDDLPAQDNSDLRRGQTSLHKTIINNDIPFNLCEGRAQLAAVDLIAISMNMINHDLIKNGFSPQCVNRVVSEISLLMHDLCIGQMMDLRAARIGYIEDNQQIDKLDQIAWFKTGKTIEVVMVMPIILNQPSSDEQNIQLSNVRQLSRLMGILFQMRDDLLDVEDNENTGKPKALDIKNNTVTYVSLLGIEGTQQRLQLFLNQSLQLVDQCWPQGSETIKDVIRYIVTRKT